MIHSASPQSRSAVKICFVIVDFEKWGWTDGQMYRQTYGQTICVNIVITTVVGLVDQKKEAGKWFCQNFQLQRSLWGFFQKALAC